MSDDDLTQYRVRIWKGRNPDGEDYQGEPDKVVTVTEDEPHVWQDDPYYHSPPIGLDIHPDDGPATLNVYTNDSVREPSPRDFSAWNGPVERGLPYPADHDYPPFGCEVWGRFMLHVEAGEMR